jgi:hypothetical protein
VDGLVYEGPRGAVQFRGNHAEQEVYIARAVGFDFDVLGDL